MIKKFNFFGLIIGISLAFIGCGGDNSYDGKTGLIAGKTSVTTDAFTSIQQNVMIPSANNFHNASTTLKTTLEKLDDNTTLENLRVLQSAAKNVMLGWKSVQSTFVAADYDTDMEDLPLLIDHFHTGNEDTSALIDRVLRLSGNLEGLLYKNSTKGITALEYLVFGNQLSEQDMLILMQKDNNRRIEALKIVATNIESKAIKVVGFYESDSKFAKDAKAASDSLVNVFIASSYKLKEWRLGDPAGYTVKYKGKPDSKRLEFYKSKFSLEAIKEILTTQESVMKTQSFSNYANFAIQNGASKEIKEVQDSLSAALAIVDSFDTPIEDAINSDKVQKLYTALSALYNAYYVSLINALDITSKIVEADGD